MAALKRPVDEGRLWSWMRSAMSHAVTLRQDHDLLLNRTRGEEAYSAALDAAAASRSQELWEQVVVPVQELKPMSTAPTNCPIVAYCKHGADPGPDENGRLSLYMGHAEGLSRVEDGWHVLVWGGAWDDRSLEDPGAGWLPDWWFVNDGTFEVAANPIGWLVALPNEEPEAPHA